MSKQDGNWSISDSVKPGRPAAARRARLERIVLVAVAFAGVVYGCAEPELPTTGTVQRPVLNLTACAGKGNIPQLFTDNCGWWTSCDSLNDLMYCTPGGAAYFGFACPECSADFCDLFRQCWYCPASYDEIVRCVTPLKKLHKCCPLFVVRDTKAEVDAGDAPDVSDGD